jgi:predicted nicotinamide N-methyase
VTGDWTSDNKKKNGMVQHKKIMQQKICSNRIELRCLVPEITYDVFFDWRENLFPPFFLYTQHIQCIMSDFQLEQRADGTTEFRFVFGDDENDTNSGAGGDASVSSQQNAPAQEPGVLSSTSQTEAKQADDVGVFVPPSWSNMTDTDEKASASASSWWAPNDDTTAAAAAAAAAGADSETETAAHAAPEAQIATEILQLIDVDNEHIPALAPEPVAGDDGILRRDVIVYNGVPHRFNAHRAEDHDVSTVTVTEPNPEEQLQSCSDDNSPESGVDAIDQEADDQEYDDESESDSDSDSEDCDAPQWWDQVDIGALFQSNDNLPKAWQGDHLKFAKKRFTDLDALHLETTDLREALLDEQDVVKSVYEGGFKLWECALDVMRYLCIELSKQHAETPTQSMNGLNVLELGCGHGLPSLFAIRCGANHVVMQDLNREVLTNLTVPNAIRNSVADMKQASSSQVIHASSITDRASFVVGDWRNADISSAIAAPVQAHTNNHDESLAQFDLILTSDTLYSLDTSKALLQQITNLLKPSGRALVAAKRFYFGVGGSTTDFMELVESYAALECQVVRVFADGSSNIREIVQVTKKQAP